MSQFLTQSLNQQMRLEQRLTPQLIQSMAILQKPVADLEAYIAEALEKNAALEVDEREGHAAERIPAPKNDGAATDEGFARAESWTRMHEYDGEGPAPRARHIEFDDRDPKLGAMANTEGRPPSLNEHLLDQWRLLDLDEETRRAGETIINYLDPDGYFRVHIEDIVAKSRPPVAREALEAALAQVQALDPAGVGARDIVECLLLQLDRLPGDNRLERTLIQHHLDDLANNRLPAVARATGCSIGEITEAIKAMRSSLSLHPGYLVNPRETPIVRPDIIVDYADTGGGLDIRLARGNAPRLRIKPEVLELARSRANGKGEREFARRHVEEASALIDAIRFRRGRLLEVAKAIVEKQCEFFDIGAAGLKVFRMSDLATELGCDPSTISRTVADKYMQTPRGVFPLRYFFTGGTETDEGESMGWDRVKSRVRELVDSETKAEPLNDDQIAELLKCEGIDISRRTVAKYRQQLGIPPARRRKEF